MRVLLVEDDHATAQGIEMMLRSESYVCDVTDMGEDGLEIGKLNHEHHAGPPRQWLPAFG